MNEKSKNYIKILFLLCLVFNNLESGIWDIIFPGGKNNQNQETNNNQLSNPGNFSQNLPDRAINVINNNNCSNNFAPNLLLFNSKNPFDFDYQKIREEINTQKNNLSNKFDELSLWAKTHKKRLFLSFIFTSHLLSQSYLKYLEHKLQNNTCWSLWLRSRSIEDIYLLSKDDFSKDLILNIQNVYTSITNPTDFITPLIKFITDVDNEIKNLKNYRNIVNTYNKLYLNKIMFYDKKLAESLDDRQKKLIYMRSCFLSWLADYKIFHNSNNNQSQYRHLLNYRNLKKN